VFSLRREATRKSLEAHNAEVSDEIKGQIRKRRSIDQQRTTASLEGLTATDVEAGGKILRSAGFGNVRTGLQPDGTFNIAFANTDTHETARATGLYSRDSTYKGTIDPTSTATYARLTPGEHDFLVTGCEF